MRVHKALSFLLAASVSFACQKRPSFEKDRERLKEYIVEKAPADIHPLDIDFDGKVRLIGFTLRPMRLRPGRDARLVLYWKAQKPVEAGFHLYTYLLDGSGDRVLSLDSIGPLREASEGRPALPPEAWEPGKVYVDQLTFRVPNNFKTSKAQIVAGLARGTERMPITAGAKDSAGRGIVADLRVAVKRPRRRTPPVPSIQVEKLPSSAVIRIDGKLDEPAWKAAPALELVDVDTGKRNRRFPVDAVAKLLWNDEGMLVAFEVKDKDVWGGFPKDAKDPHLWTRDTVEIMIDPDGDGDNLDYYEVQIGPQNLVFDSRFDSYNTPKQEPHGPFGHQDWSSNVRSAVVVKGTLDRRTDEDEGYVVEALLPWTAFSKAKRSPPAPGDTWRINLYAIQENGGVAWSPILRQGNFHKADRFARVTWTARDAGGAVATPAASAVAPAPPPR